MQRPDVRLERGLLAELGDPPVDLGARLVVGLLDTRRVDAAVLEQLFERDARDLATDAVEAREQDRCGRVVDDEVDSRQRLERPDVAALAPDDAALQLVGLELYDRDRGLDRVRRSHALHAGREDAARAAVGVVAGLLLPLAHEASALVPELRLELLEDDLLRLPGAEARHPLQLAQLRAPIGFGPVEALVEGAGALLERHLARGEVAE